MKFSLYLCRNVDYLCGLLINFLQFQTKVKYKRKEVLSNILELQEFSKTT